jgi:hypothetical protein
MTTLHTPTGGQHHQLPASVVRLGWFLLAGGMLICGAGYMADTTRSAFNNVILFMFLASLAGGSVFLLALEYITGAVWSVPMRRINEFLAGLTPLIPLFALPMLFNMHGLFHWSHADAVAQDDLLAKKSPYLNVTFFVVRFLIVAAVWNLFYLLFTRNSRRQDTTRDPRLTTVNIRLAAAFLPLFAVTLTVVAVDWAMSLEPHWFSTIFGVYYFAGTALAAVSAATYVIIRFQERGMLRDLRRDHLYSLGALMFAFINFWAYIAFSQFLLVWYANLPEETVWFMARWKGGWEYVSVLLIIVHFVVPYFALLMQDSKMDPKRLKLMALWILAAHMLDLYWLVMPTYSPTLSVSWMDIGYPAVAVGLVIVVLAYKVQRNNLVPIGDPKLERGLSFRL